MTAAHVSGVVGYREIPEEIRRLTPMRDVDYADCFTVATDRAPGRTPEQWVRAVAEDAAGLSGQFVWRAILGLRLAWRASPDHVAGWTIADRGDTWMRLEATSWLLSAHVVTLVQDPLLSVAVFIRHRNPAASLIVPPVALAHRRALPRFLRDAVDRQALGRTRVHPLTGLTNREARRRNDT